MNVCMWVCMFKCEYVFVWCIRLCENACEFVNESRRVSLCSTVCGNAVNVCTNCVDVYEGLWTGGLWVPACDMGSASWNCLWLRSRPRQITTKPNNSTLQRLGLASLVSLHKRNYWRRGLLQDLLNRVEAKPLFWLDVTFCFSCSWAASGCVCQLQS